MHYLHVHNRIFVHKGIAGRTGCNGEKTPWRRVYDLAACLLYQLYRRQKPISKPVFYMGSTPDHQSTNLDLLSSSLVCLWCQITHIVVKKPITQENKVTK